MKKFISIVLAIALCVGCLAMFSGCEKDENVIKIGVFEPATGSNGAGGKQETLGIEYANDVCPTITLDGVEYTVKLVKVDNGSDDAKGVTAAAELVNKGVCAVVGSYGSSVSIAAGPTFDGAGLAAIGITCTNEQVTAGNDYYFRICFLDPFQGAVLAKNAWDKGVRKAYTLAETGNAYDLGLASSFKTAFEKLGGEIIAANFAPNTADFNSYITSAVNSGAGCIFAPTSTQYAQQIITQAASQNVTIPLMAGDTWDSNVILDAAKGTNLTIEITTFYQEGANKEFDEGFKAWLDADSSRKTDNGGNLEISAVSAMGYDVYFTVLEAIKLAGSADKAEVKKALPNVEYTGVSGLIKFNETGDADRNVAYIKKADTATGTWSFVKEQGID